MKLQKIMQVMAISSTLALSLSVHNTHASPTTEELQKHGQMKLLDESQTYTNISSQNLQAYNGAAVCLNEIYQALANEASKSEEQQKIALKTFVNKINTLNVDLNFLKEISEQESTYNLEFIELIEHIIEEKHEYIDAS